MPEKYVRGRVVTFKSSPRDEYGNPVIPAAVRLYVNYVHADGTSSTDAPIEMAIKTDGRFHASFDTEVCEPGPFFASIRAENPAAAHDIKLTIIANPANPDP